ncbi:hypothetical protein [Thiorhodovibrio frisius]|uniref:Uncharacterized protein n=1 Tax=Thiorhodovibrio frisius TaxID=631362 RepID=H8Z122_9GAMM|nr:hypothetical protein [Thiorhodovibrio frisius]EIC22443.1 hypothetical protein Thi970DRAFT_02709 [Thiorhodovibrio frisius]WPL24744.1 hypothetical protein Thiofri_04968 [Thiorhodovibrio frisius]
MTTLELASLIMSAEFALASAVILFIVRRRQRSAARTQETQTAELHQSVESEIPSRRESLTKLFQANAQLKGRQLTTTVNQFLSREQAFYDAMLNIYLNKDGKSLADIPDELRKVLTPWAELQESANEDSAVAGDLQAENTELSQQLEHNKEIIERLLEEYDATFNKFQHAEEPPPEDTGERPTEEPEEEESLEDQINDILSSEPPEAEQNFDDIDAARDETEGDEEEPLIFSNNDEDETEELADLFDSVQSDDDKPKDS